MELKNSDPFRIFEGLNIPVAYHYFKDPPDLPYLIFFQAGSNNFNADNRVFVRDCDYTIELYSQEKDFELEEKLENLLDEYEICWEKSEDIRMEDEGFTMIVYQI